MQGMGMTGALGTTSSMRPAGVPSNQLRPSQSSLRPQTSSSSQSPVAQVASIWILILLMKEKKKLNRLLMPFMIKI